MSIINTIRQMYNPPYQILFRLDIYRSLEPLVSLAILYLPSSNTPN